MRCWPADRRAGVGGGPAGLGAAIGAADAGARVILTERYGFLGATPLRRW